MKTTKRLYTAKRLYFTCPIKALYMMKEFGVKFEWRQKVKASEYDIFHDWGKTELHTGHTVDDFIDEVKWSNQIYVAVESEHIFELMTADLINYKSRSGKNRIAATYLENFIDDDNQPKWKLQSQGMNSPKIYRIDQRPCEIIMRDNKQFFMPEVENENN